MKEITKIKYHTKNEVEDFTMKYFLHKFIEPMKKGERVYFPMFLDGVTECLCCHKLMMLDGEFNEDFYDCVLDEDHDAYVGIVCRQCMENNLDEEISENCGMKVRVADWIED